MLKNVSNSFINACNSISITLTEYVVLNGVSIPIRAILRDDCYENGNFIGNVIFKTITFEVDNQYDFKNKEFVYHKVVNGEDVVLGTFITTEVEDSDTNQIMKVIGMDYGLKTQVEYSSALDYSSGEITLMDVWNECCSMSGLESGISSFTNSDFIVDSDQFTGTGATIRDVFKAIALSSSDFVKVMNDDKIYLVFNENTNDIIEDYTELEDKRDTHPITCVRLGMSNIQGENVDLKDDELVEEYGENWLVINDNPFAYSLVKRQELITNILDKVKGFGYSSFMTKTSFKPYLTCGDVVQFRNRSGNLVNTIILRYEQDYDEIMLSAPSEISASVNWVRPSSAIDVVKRTEIIVDRDKVRIDSLTAQTQTIQDNLNNNYYTIDQANVLVQNAQAGLTNTFSEAGGNNIFRNTGLWFENTGSDAQTNPYEFWNGLVVRAKEDKASNGNGMLLQNTTLSQEQIVPNGTYTVSFKYKVLIPTTVASVEINGVSYSLEAETDTEFVQVIETTSQHIKLEFICETNGGCEIYDLMVNAGGVKLAYSQNQNETTTDTVNISKGITITSSDTDTTFKANADGIRTLDNNGNELTVFTDRGTRTKELIVENQATICNTLIQDISGQTWFTRL